jgi:hypothetical protein
LRKDENCEGKRLLFPQKDAALGGKLKSLIVAWIVVVAPAGTGLAAPVFTQINSSGTPYDVSPDGTRVAGKNGNASFYWSAISGYVGVGGDGSEGYARISSDGTKICGVINDASNLKHSAIYTVGSGWVQLPPAGTAAFSQYYDNPFGMSADGDVVVGLYWIAAGRSGAYKWLQSTGMSVGLPAAAPNVSSSASDVSADGTIVGGWTRVSVSGNHPAVWHGLTLTYLPEEGAVGGVSENGQHLVGTYSPTAAATMCKWDANLTNRVEFGLLSGTVGGVSGGITDDGCIAVGLCSLLSARTAYFWSQTTGIVRFGTLLTNWGIAPSNQIFLGLTSITPDGNSVVGYMSQTGTTSVPFHVSGITRVAPSSFQVTEGMLFGGGLTDLTQSDDNRLFILNDEFNVNATISVAGTSLWAQASKIYVRFEASASRTDLSEFISLHNFASSTWTGAGFQSSTLTDSVLQGVVLSNVNAHIESGSRAVRARIQFIPQSDLEAADGWVEAIDEARITVMP